MKLKNLDRISHLYEKNFEMLLFTVGTPEHKKYVKIERKLNKLDEKLRSKLGLFIKDPCPLSKRSIRCEECIGKYIKIPRKGKFPRGRTETIQNRSGVSCNIKESLNEMRDLLKRRILTF